MLREPFFWLSGAVQYGLISRTELVAHTGFPSFGSVASKVVCKLRHDIQIYLSYGGSQE